MWIVLAGWSRRGQSPGRADAAVSASLPLNVLGAARQGFCAASALAVSGGCLPSDAQTRGQDTYERSKHFGALVAVR